MSATKQRVVLVGCGGMARAWMDVATAMDEVQVVGLVDVRREAAEQMAQRHGLDGSVVFDALTQALAESRPDIVFDVTVPEAHDQVTIEALRAGCHVLGEKPMAVSLDKARRMVAEAARAGRLYAVIQNRRYEPNIQRVRGLIESGVLGTVEEVHCDFYIGAHFGGFRDQMEHPLLLDMAIHTFDAARYLSGADPQRVYCHAFNPGRSWYRGDASATAIFEMTGNVVYTYRGSWCAEGLPTSWNSQWRIIGSRGTVLWDGGENVRAQAVAEGGRHSFHSEMREIEAPAKAVPHLGHEGLIREFVRCVREGQTPQTTCTDNIKSLAMVLAAVESARQGQRVNVTW